MTLMYLQSIMFGFISRLAGLFDFHILTGIADDFSSAVTAWLTAILSWLVAAFTGMVPVFYVPATGLTFIGWLLVFGIAVAFTRLAFNFIQRAARM